MVVKTKNNQTLFTSLRSRNTYTVNFNNFCSNDIIMVSEKGWIVAMVQ